MENKVIAMNTINIYQILPRIATNKGERNIPNGTIEENGCGKLNYFTDVFFKSVKDMGFTHVWFTGIIEHATKTNYDKIIGSHPGIVKGKAGSPYAIRDYYDIDPDLAENVENRMTEFEKLIKRTHQSELKLIIDFVPNHVARQYHSDTKPRGIKDLGENDNKNCTFSPENNFYYFPNQPLRPQFDTKGYEEQPAKASGNDQFSPFPSISDWYETIKLNYGIDYFNSRISHFDPIPDTWKKMINILIYWAQKGIDGFRCDMAEMVPVEFWQYAIPIVKEKSKRPNIIFIAEVYNPTQYRNYIINGHFDYLYDKVGLYDTLRAITMDQASASCITNCWQNLNDIQSHMLNFLENHDEQRIASDFFAGYAQKIYPALIVSMTLTNSPFMVYNGQELGEKGMDSEGFSGRDGKTTIFDYWSVDKLHRWMDNGNFDEKKLTNEEKNIREFYKRLLKIRIRENSLNKGSMYDLMWINYDNNNFDTNHQYAFFRQHGDDLLLIAVNFHNLPVKININITAHALEFLNLPDNKVMNCIDLLTKEKYKITLSSQVPIKIVMEKYNGIILKLK